MSGGGTLACRGAARWSLACGLGALLVGCYTGLPEGSSFGDGQAGSEDEGGEASDGSDGGSDGGDPNRPPDAPTDSVPIDTVPDVLELVDSESFCRTLAAGQDVVGVSPDGFLWLAETTGVADGVESTRFEVIDPWTKTSSAAPTDLELGSMVSVQPRSADDAVVVAASDLWHVDAWSRVQLVPPESYTASASTCGNPRDNGYLLAAGTVFEHRDDGWWGLTPEAADEGTPNAIVTLDGECNGPADETWLSSPDGTIWRVSADSIVQGLVFDGWQAAVGTGDTLAVLADGELWLGPSDWSRYEFEAGMPSTIAASGGSIWIAVGSRVLRSSEGVFAELAHGMTDDIDAVLAHADGVWLHSGTEVCHQTTGPRFRVDGVHPYLRSPAIEHAFTVRPEDIAATVTAAVDGEDVPVLSGENGFAGVATLQGLGWHRIDIVVTSAQATAERTVWVRREVPNEVSFAADVAPIAAEHCSGDACHSAMTTGEVPVLETLEAWTMHADGIDQRVVELDNMPPLGVRSDEWGSDEVETIAKWIEGGMLP